MWDQHKYIVFKNLRTEELSWVVFYTSYVHKQIARIVESRYPDVAALSAGFITFTDKEETANGEYNLRAYGFSSSLGLGSRKEDSDFLRELVDIEAWIKDPFQEPVYHPSIAV